MEKIKPRTFRALSWKMYKPLLLRLDSEHLWGECGMLIARCPAKFIWDCMNVVTLYLNIKIILR